MRLLLFLILTLAIPMAAQKDFLTADEADQVRDVQEPNERLKLYVKFARTRIALIEQLLSKEKAGRSSMIHEALEEYRRILEAIDTVSDDALRRKVPIEIGATAVAQAEKEMLAKLEKIKTTKTRDYSRYEDALSNAVDDTNTSIELAQMDSKDRSRDVVTKDEKEKKDREALMTPKELAEKKAEEKKEAVEAPKKKAPTLRRKGEVDKKP